MEIIRPSTSPYNFPIWVVPKKADSLGNPRWRVVTDFKKLNEFTEDDRYRILYKIRFEFGIFTHSGASG